MKFSRLNVLGILLLCLFIFWLPLRKDCRDTNPPSELSKVEGHCDETSSESRIIETLKHIKSRTAADERKLHHPSYDLDDLWFKLSPIHVVRRLGYFDTRDKTHISVVFITMLDMRNKTRPQLYASLIYRGNKEVCVHLENWTESGQFRAWDHTHYFTVLYRTRINSIPTNEAPLHAFIGHNCSEYNAYIPIQYNKPKERLTFGVCLHQALRDLNEPQILVDWVELNILLGAEIITVYLQNVPESYYTAMIPYIEKGIVEVLDWNLKPPLIPRYTKNWGQTGTITECIYRNLYRVKYLGLIDVDEFFVPQQKTTRSIVELLKDIDEMTKSENPASFIFYNTWFFDNNVTLPELNTDAASKKCPKKSWPRYLTFTQQTADPEAEHKNFWFHKIIIKVEAVNAAWYHYTLSVKEGYSKGYYVPANYGLLHHYRVPSKAPKHIEKKSTFVMSKYFDDTMKHYLSKYWLLDSNNANLAKSYPSDF